MNCGLSFSEDFHIDYNDNANGVVGGMDNWCTLPTRLNDTEDMYYRNANTHPVLMAKFKPGRKWTNEEDEILVQLMKVHDQDWKAIARGLPNKTPKQIKERFQNQLDASVIDQAFTFEEDVCLLMHIRAVGRSWMRISKFMPGRSELMLKNRYHSFLKKRLEPEFFQASFALPDLHHLTKCFTLKCPRKPRATRIFTTVLICGNNKSPIDSYSIL
jgi:hypothetical protein